MPGMTGTGLPSVAALSSLQKRGPAHAEFSKYRPAPIREASIGGTVDLRTDALWSGYVASDVPNHTCSEPRETSEKNCVAGKYFGTPERSQAL